ncbi:hypothetical protein B0H19DRAFT_1108354, partial [Mycena capillaripes]
CSVFGFFYLFYFTLTIDPGRSVIYKALPPHTPLSLTHLLVVRLRTISYATLLYRLISLSLTTHLLVVRLRIISYATLLYKPSYSIVFPPRSFQEVARLLSCSLLLDVPVHRSVPNCIYGIFRR